MQGWGLAALRKRSRRSLSLFDGFLRLHRQASLQREGFHKAGNQRPGPPAPQGLLGWASILPSPPPPHPPLPPRSSPFPNQFIPLILLHSLGPHRMAVIFMQTNRGRNELWIQCREWLHQSITGWMRDVYVCVCVCMLVLSANTFTHMLILTVNVYRCIVSHYRFGDSVGDFESILLCKPPVIQERIVKSTHGRNLD